MTALAIGILPVANAGDADDEDFIGNFIDDSKAPDPDPPVVFRTDKLSATGWTGIFSECSDRSRQLRTNFGGVPFEVLFRGTIYDDLEHGC